MQYANMIGQGIYTEHYHKRIHCRSGHVAVPYKGHMLVWAGFTENRDMELSEYLNTDEVIVYNSCTEVWSRIITFGDTPKKNSGSCGVILDDCLYVYGGFQEIGTNYDLEANINHIYCLDLQTMVWKKLNPTGVVPAACDKLAGWTYNGKLYFFGGFGPAPENPLDVPFMHIQSYEDTHMRGWNNQLLCYDPDTNICSWPTTRGQIPCPRAAHAADITGSKLYLFGGRLRERRMATLHCLNMETMMWSAELTGKEAYSPEGRSWHSFTFISNDMAILYGGFSQQSMILNDCWVLELPEVKWKFFAPHTRGQPRLWHKGVYLKSSRTLIMVGGHMTSVFAPQSSRNRIGNQQGPYQSRVHEEVERIYFDDCWRLHTSEVVMWEEVRLAYDHGHPRFWHVSVCGAPGEMLIHGGLVQPFYQLEFYIQEHADRLLKLHFEPKSLLRLCLNAALDNYQQTSPQWPTLPVMLHNILISRHEQM